MPILAATEGGVAHVGTAGASRIEQAGKTRFARVEALRAICCLGVITAHVWGYSQGWDAQLTYGEYWRRAMMVVGQVGVPIFFAASGYLLYLPFARRDFAGGGRVDVRTYLLNRARRIFPLYYVALVLVLLFWENGGSFTQWWRFLIFAQNFSVETEGTVNGALWSLVVDLYFYFLLPVIALGLARLARGRLRVAVGVLIGCLLLSWGCWHWGTTHLDAARRLWQHNLPASFCFLAAGMLLALLRVHMSRSARDWTRGPLGNPDLWILAALPTVAIAVDRLNLQYLNAISAFLILGATALPLGQGRMIRILDWRPLAVVGVMTFSMYIWQGPVIHGLVDDEWVPGGFLGLCVVALPIILAAGTVSYRLVERPFLSQRRTWSADTAARGAPPPAPDRDVLAPAGGTAPVAAPATSSS